MTDAIHSKLSSTNPTSATIVIEGTITMTLNIIHATVNGAPPANAKAAPTSLLPNNPWDQETFPHPGPFAHCVTENSSEKTATHPISCADPSKYAPYVTLTKVPRLETRLQTGCTVTTWKTCQRTQGWMGRMFKLRETSQIGHTPMLHSTSTRK